MQKVNNLTEKNQIREQQSGEINLEKEWLEDKPLDGYISLKMEDYIDEIQDVKTVAATIQKKYTAMPRSLR